MSWSRTSRLCASRAFVLAASLAAALATPGLFNPGASAQPTGGSPNTCPTLPKVTGPLQSWATVANLPVPRTHLAATTGCDGKIYAIGGESTGTAGGGAGRTTGSPTGTVSPTGTSSPTTTPSPTRSPNETATGTPSPTTQGPTGPTTPTGSPPITSPAMTPAAQTDDVPTAPTAPTPGPTIGTPTATSPTTPGSPTSSPGAGALAPVGTVQVYDPAKDAWADAAALPTPRTHLAAATDAEGRIYAIGGRAGKSNEPTDIVEVYTPSSGSWSTGTALPSAMGDPSATRGADGKIYVIDATSMAIYNPETRDWNTAEAPPSKTAAPVLAALPDGRILAAGGGSMTGGGGAAQPSGDVFAYQPGSGAPENGTWNKVADLPTPVAGAAGATGPDGRVYVIGGRGSGGTVTGDVQVYSPDDGTWASGPSNPDAGRAGHAAATGGDGHVYVVGGTSGSGDPTDSVAALTE